MLTVGDALAKTLSKSQKITFRSKKNSFRCFFFLTAGDALTKANVAMNSKRKTWGTVRSSGGAVEKGNIPYCDKLRKGVK